MKGCFSWDLFLFSSLQHGTGCVDDLHPRPCAGGIESTWDHEELHGASGKRELLYTRPSMSHPLPC